MKAEITAQHPALSLAGTLTSRGHRLTRQRRILLGVLESASSHLNAKELLQQAKEQDLTIDRATVYRTLTLLKHEGLIDELDLMHLGGPDHYYERRRQGDHAHVGCVRCGEVVELETDLVEALAGEIEGKTGYAASSIRIEVRALCPACRGSR